MVLNMALNFGAALGAAAKSGMDTYMSMEENERRKKELAFKEQEAAYQEEQRNQERKLNEITGQTLGMGDTRVTGQDYTGVTGGIDTAEPALKTEAYTPQQKMADFKQRALAAGVPLQKVTATAGAHRAEKYAEREEMALGFSQQIRDEIAADPTNLGAVFKKHFQDAYNAGKLPGLGDGKTAEVVPMGTGGESIVLRDEKGKAVRTIPLTVDTIESITKKWGDLMMRDSNPANYWKSREEDLKARQVGATEKSADAAMKSAEAAVMNAKTNQQAESAKSEYYRALAKKTGQTMTDQKLELIEANSAIIMRANPNMSKAEADLKAAQEIFKSPEARAGVVTPDQINTFIQNNPDLMQKKGKSGKMEPLSATERVDVARTALTRGTGGGATPTNATDAALAKASAGGADPFAPKGSQPPGAVDTENVPAPPASAIPSGPTRYGNIDPAMQDRLQADVNAISKQIVDAEAALRATPNLVNAQNLQRLRLERDKLAANPLLR